MTPAQYRKRRLSLGLTQAGLAALLGVQRETICRREAGEVEITREMVRAICSVTKPKHGKLY